MKPSTRRVLDALWAAGSTGATTAELGQADVGGFRFGARIHELRNDHGCRIAAQCVRAGSYRFTLDRSTVPSSLVPAGTRPPAAPSLVPQVNDFPPAPETWPIIEHAPEHVPDVPPDLHVPCQLTMFDAAAAA